MFEHRMSDASALPTRSTFGTYWTSGTDFCCRFVDETLLLVVGMVEG